MLSICHLRSVVLTPEHIGAHKGWYQVSVHYCMVTDDVPRSCIRTVIRRFRSHRSQLQAPEPIMVVSGQHWSTHRSQQQAAVKPKIPQNILSQDNYVNTEVIMGMITRWIIAKLNFQRGLYVNILFIKLQTFIHVPAHFDLCQYLVWKEGI